MLDQGSHVTAGHTFEDPLSRVHADSQQLNADRQ